MSNVRELCGGNRSPSHTHIFVCISCFFWEVLVKDSEWSHLEGGIVTFLTPLDIFTVVIQVQELEEEREVHVLHVQFFLFYSSILLMH